ncbi:MAG: class I adenylate-forming enzyme family protein [Pseudomonadota bacterium]
MPNISRQFFTAAKHDKTAIVCDGDALSFSVLAERVAKISRGLAEEGVRPGDAIALMGSNSIDYVAIMLAAADLGAVLVPLSGALPTHAARRAIETSDAKHLIASAERLSSLRADDTKVSGVTLALGDDTDSLNALVRAAPNSAAPSFWGRTDDPYILTMTSGSTGAPKPIILTQRSKLERAGAAVRLYDITSEDKILAATPLYHSLAERLALIPMLIGAQSILMSRYSPDLWIECVDTHEASFTIAVASQLSAVAKRLEAQGQSSQRCLSLRCVVSSSAPLSHDAKTRVLSALPGELHECYGASEIAIATSLNLTKPDAPIGSVGRPAPGVDIRILSDDGAELPIGETGEITCRTPMLFGGYYGRDDLTEAALQDEFFKTGDLGRLDETGALFYQGRKKDVIITGGVNVYPADVETAIQSLPGVDKCAAFAWPDERLGEAVAIAIVASDAKLSARAVRSWCATRLADFQQPQRIVFTDVLPVNTMGKLVRNELYETLSNPDQATSEDKIGAGDQRAA